MLMMMPCWKRAITFSEALKSYSRFQQGSKQKRFHATKSKKTGGKSHEWSEEIPITFFYVLKKREGSPPHSTTIIDIIRFRNSIANLL
ncbi:hypothetical protein EZS27_026790, partial [termite gut metagenome]